MTETLTTFLAICSLLCWAGTLVTVVLAVLARRNPTGEAAGWFASVRHLSLWAAWLVAAVAVAGSLYYSEGAHYLPCELCWMQRICMYPLAITLLVAAATRDTKVWRYVVGPAVAGIVIAAYHTQLTAYPDQKSFCSSFNPCATRYVWEWGFVSIPFMALAGFAFILTMVLVARTTPAPGAADGQPASGDEVIGSTNE